MASAQDLGFFCSPPMSSFGRVEEVFWLCAGARSVCAARMCLSQEAWQLRFVRCICALPPMSSNTNFGRSQCKFGRSRPDSNGLQIRLLPKGGGVSSSDAHRSVGMRRLTSAFPRTASSDEAKATRNPGASTERGVWTPKPAIALLRQLRCVSSPQIGSHPEIVDKSPEMPTPTKVEPQFDPLAEAEKI